MNDSYRYPRCSRAHRSHQAAAKCRWRGAEWVMGDGPYALVAYCRVITVTLHATREAAEEAKRGIDRTACGGFCHRDHHIVRIDLAPARKVSV